MILDQPLHIVVTAWLLRRLLPPRERVNITTTGAMYVDAKTVVDMVTLDRKQPRTWLQRLLYARLTDYLKSCESALDLLGGAVVGVLRGEE